MLKASSSDGGSTASDHRENARDVRANGKWEREGTDILFLQNGAGSRRR
jgi:hypothetical protein